MFSKRPVEDLTYYQIKRFFQNLLKENNDIINNASVETYAFKKAFGERLLAFFNIFLAAMLLSSFILYSTASWRWKLCVMSAIVFITLLALLLYCMDVAKKFSEQYKRQRTYREINIEIHIILANLVIFFAPARDKDSSMISIATLQQFTEVIKDICEERNRNLDKFFIATYKDWKPIFATIVIVIILMIIVVVVFVLCICGVIK